MTEAKNAPTSVAKGKWQQHLTYSKDFLPLTSRTHTFTCAQRGNRALTWQIKTRHSVNNTSQSCSFRDAQVTYTAPERPWLILQNWMSKWLREKSPRSMYHETQRMPAKTGRCQRAADSKATATGYVEMDCFVPVLRAELITSEWVPGTEKCQQSPQNMQYNKCLLWRTKHLMV